jgi:hypothetical protein
VGLLCGSCGAAHHLPKEETVINYKDSTIFHILDSVRVTEATRYKDMAWLGDSLKLVGNHSRAWAVADTAKGALIGCLEEDKVEERYKIIYKDRIVKKDSLVFKEIPVEVEKVKEVVPRWAWWSLAFNIIGILLIGLLIYLKLKL